MSDRAPVENPRRVLTVVFAVVFVDLVGFGILVPVIPLYTEHFGANEFVVGLLMVPILYVLVTAVGRSGEPTPA